MPTTASSPPSRDFRAVFLSDFHLGARACRPGPILDFLRTVETETLYLVGDILDVFHGGRLHWTPEHNAIIAEIERSARSGTRVVYLPGNHDAALRAPDAVSPFAGAEMRDALVHTGADGRRHLVLHGDQCDPRLLRLHVFTRLGSRADALLRRLDAAVKRRFGAPRRERSAIEGFIAMVNGAMTLGDRFETRLVALADAAGVDGVICGHSHRPALTTGGPVAYANCGDWIDSFTALVEHHDGGFALVEARAEPVSQPVRPIPAPLGRLGMEGRT